MVNNCYILLSHCVEIDVNQKVIFAASQPVGSVTNRTHDKHLTINTMVVAQHQLAASGDDKTGDNRRISFFEEAGELAPGQLYSTESGR